MRQNCNKKFQLTVSKISTFLIKTIIPLLITCHLSIVTIRSIWHNSVTDFMHFGKFLPQICESCGATCQWKYEMFSAL